MDNTEYLDNKDFLQWLDSIGFDKNALKTEITNDETSRLDDLVRRFKQQENNSGKEEPKTDKAPAEEQKDAAEEQKDAAEPTPAPYLEVSQKPKEGDDKEKDWIQEKRESYTNWCEKEHTPTYIFDEDKDNQSGIKFSVYKTEEDKQAGKAGATYHYTSKDKVSLEGEGETSPDYEYFDKLAKEAKKDGFPGITFSGEMTPDFQARLAAACIANGLKMINGPEKVDMNELGNVSDDIKKQVTNFNTTADYKKLYDAQKAQAAQFKQDNPDKPFDIKAALEGKEVSPAETAIMYAAYANTGVTVEGIKDVNKESAGMFSTEAMKLLPEEVKKTAVDYNYGVRQEQLQGIRSKRQQLFAQAMSSDDHDIVNAAKKLRGLSHTKDKARKEGTKLTKEQRVASGDIASWAQLQDKLNEGR